MRSCSSIALWSCGRTARACLRLRVVCGACGLPLRARGLRGLGGMAGIVKVSPLGLVTITSLTPCLDCAQARVTRGL